ncbi:MAG: PEP-CTERM sorting domain-containing protein [Planctomycetia bacterium]|nr:PEP-CTERM sorting domain-containing protein [Planctomycetia bacterium]
MAVIACVLVFAQTAHAVDIFGTQNAALDQPVVEGLLQRPGDSQPLTGHDLGISSFNITAYLDTGASGILISGDTATVLGLNTLAGVSFSDTGVAGTSNFGVSESVSVRVAHTPFSDLDNPANFTTVYDQSFGPLRTQVGPIPQPQNPDLLSLDVFGTPVMAGKVVVMDPKPLNDLSGGMNTYLYNPATSFNPAKANSDPGIPTTSHHVALSQADFDRFTQVTPAGSPVPNFSHNPFIGPNPVLQSGPSPPVDNTPPVSIDFNGHHSSGSFLLDTGAATSFISTAQAAKLDVRYATDSHGISTGKLEIFNPANPAAPGTPVANQFSLQVGGIGGTLTAAGFYLDDLILHTKEGSLNDADPNNIRYMGAPVLVNDVSVFDPAANQLLTIDGVFGMNFLVASLFVDNGNIGNLGASGPFNWVTYDEPNATLGLDLAPVPEPGSLMLLVTGCAILAGYLWHRRGRQVRG